MTEKVIFKTASQVFLGTKYYTVVNCIDGHKVKHLNLHYNNKQNKFQSQHRIFQ